ncbi:MAG: LamG-like jellyroll fold domain-containing protein [Saprospiraceae bacterium]
MRVLLQRGWKSTNHGNTWVCVSENRMVNRVYAIEIDPTNCDVVYAEMENSIYVSNNGGGNWSPTGDAAFQSIDMEVADIKFNPGTGDLWAATNQGLFFSTSGVVLWTLRMSGDFQEIEFHPSNSNIMYVIRQTGDLTEFHKSTNAGTTFTQQTSGWPVPPSGSENKRAEIAVTAAAPDKVYALLTGSVNGGSGLYGFYVSTDSGVSWTFSCCGPQPGGPPSTSNINMMAWSDIGTDDGGQYYYDLGLAVSPTDANKVFVAGVNTWVSSDGGASFTCPAQWSHPDKPNYVHADVHDINFHANGDLWIACDGGVFYSGDNGANFYRSMYGITGTDFWGFGLGFNNDELMVGGAYHNGTQVKNGSIYDNDWVCIDGGDGVGGAVNPIRENEIYTWFNIKTMPDNRLEEPTTRNYASEPTWHYTTGRFSQVEFASDNYNVHYFGVGSSLVKTEDDNRTVSTIYSFNYEVTDVEVAWNNPQIIYVATYQDYWGAKQLFRSTDGGFSFTEITPPTSVFSSRRYCPYDIEVSYEDPNLIWIARLQHDTGDDKKVFRSANGGQTWTNITPTLMNGEVLTNIIAQRGNNDLYVGTTRTVYHSAGGGGSWQLFADGLPASTRSRQLAISYRGGTLLNATNRSVWASPLASATPASAQIAVDKYYTGCARDTFHFADYSPVPANSNFQWSFPGAAWVSSQTAKDPEVVFGEPGTYSVSLTVAGQTQTRTNLVTVGDECSPDDFAGNALVCSGTNRHFRSTGGLDVTTNTVTLMAWVKPDGIQPDYTGIVFNDDSGTGLNFKNGNQIGIHWFGHWGWNSGLYAPSEEWTFVAMTVSPTSITLYVNDDEATRTGTFSPAYWSSFRVGSYQGWSSRNMTGKVDEVVIWNRTLTRDEIRQWRHLTKHRQATPSDPLFDNQMLAYYQFNDASSTIYDRVGNYHGYLNSSASLAVSQAPVGDGTSSKLTVNGSGTYNFPNEKLQLSFPSGGTYPSGELVVTRLNNAPPILPTNALHNNSYWIVNNYGNETFSELTSIIFSGLSGISTEEAAHPEQFTLYKRSSNADTETWGTYIDQADAATTGGQVTFSNGNSVTSFSQFALAQDASLLPVVFVDLHVTPVGERTALLEWKTASEVNASHFEVTRSRDGSRFETIGTVPASNLAQGSQYQWKDETIAAGTYYYRIRAIDWDSSYGYSPIRSITFDGTKDWVEVYPNPLPQGGDLNLRCTFPDKARFDLYDANGRLVRSTVFEGAASIRLPGLPAGSYTYTVTHTQGVYNGRLVGQ